MTIPFIDQGRAKLVIDTLFHSTDPIPVTVSGITFGGDLQIGAVEIKDGTTDNRAVVTVDGDLQVTLDGEVVIVDTELSAPLNIDVDTNENTGEVAPVVLAQMVGPSGGALLRRASMAVDDDTANRSTQFSLITAADLRMFNGTTWDRVRGNTISGLLVDLGPNNDVDTELPTAVTLSDDFDNPTAPAVGAFLMGYNEVTTDWDRIGIDENNNLNVSLATVLDASEDTVRLSIATPVYRQPFTVSGTGSNLIATISGITKMKILSVLLVAQGAVTVTFESSGGNDMSGAILLDAGGAGFVLNPPASRDMYWMETATNENLHLVLSDAVIVGGLVNWFEEA